MKKREETKKVNPPTIAPKDGQPNNGAFKFE